MLYLTRIETFNAAHRIFNPDWSEEKNKETFGKCYSPNYHGHNYELHVTISGTIHPQTGFLFNAKTLSKIIKEKVIEPIDHKNLNLDVDFISESFTSAENLAVAIWGRLNPEINKYDNIRLYEIKLYETPKIYITYTGPK